MRRGFRLRNDAAKKINRPQRTLCIACCYLVRGKIGRMISRFLSHTAGYELIVADADPAALERVRQQSRVETAVLDASSPEALARLLDGQHAVISALSYSFNPAVARARWPPVSATSI